MKASVLKKVAICFIISVLWVLQISAQTFGQRLYGNNQDNSFTKVFPDGQHFYILGDEGGRATVTRISNSGLHIWTRALNMPSAFTDAVVMPTTNNLMFVGHTLPSNSLNKSIIGVISPLGVVSIQAYDTPGRESFTSIVLNPGGISCSVIGFHTFLSPQENALFLQADVNGNITSKQVFTMADSGFANDVEISPVGSNDVLIAGAFSNTAVLYQMNAFGTFVNGILESDPYTFQDVAVRPNGDILVAVQPLTATSPRLILFDANLSPVWDMDITGLDDIHQVVVSTGGDFFAVGTVNAGSVTRAVVVKLNDNFGPAVQWSRYISNNETSYTGGSIALLQLNKIAFVDGRTGNPNGLGLTDAFLAVTNGSLASNCSFNTNVTLQPHNAIWNSPEGMDVFPDTLSGMNVPVQQITRQQKGACGILIPPPICSNIKLRVESDQDGRNVFYDWIQITDQLVTLECFPPPGTFMPVGENQVVCISADSSGNESVCEFTVTIERMPYDSMQPPSPASPDGIFDKVRDQFGNPFRLSEIQIPETMNGSLLCGPIGYFNIYFEPGCGMDGNSQIEIDRRNVICQVFSDLSAFITPPNPGVKVNIWVRDITQTSASLSNTLGVATSFYTMPAGAPAIGGIVDGEIWKTIISGVDSYTGVSSPLATGGGAGAGYYHGYMAFNFTNTNPNINWHTNLSIQTSGGLYDLYSVALHEATHALGFASVIQPPGTSGFGPGYTRYFSRYDSNLRSPTGLPLITNPSACSSMYNYQFNPALNPSVLNPNPLSLAFHPDHTNCSDAIVFGGSVGQPVFTPNGFMGGSSLSHFEDECIPPIPNPLLNNKVYVMSNANGTGVAHMKRFLKQKERDALCELGYQVGNTYGNTAQHSDATYSGSCPGLGVAGVNDGISPGGNYTYTLSVGGNITIAPLLNDFGALSYECLEIVFGGGNTSLSGSTFTYTAASTGVKLLRYVPVGAGAKKGNITYIFIYVSSPGCPANICNMVANGGFENGTSCGLIFSTQGNAMIDCWERLAYSPDLFTRPCIIPGLQLGVSTYNSIPATDSHNGAPNNKIIGLFKTLTGAGIAAEAVQTQLQSPLLPGHQYTISFWAIPHNNINGPSSNIPALIQFATASNYPLVPFIFSYPPGVFPVLFPDVVVPINAGWQFITRTFTFNGTTPHSNLLIAYSPVNLPSGITQAYFFLDDVTLVEVGTNPTFSPPTPVCLTAPMVLLDPTVSIPGGVFSGPCVTNSSSGYIFDPLCAGLGNHTITYTVTDANGCTATATATIQVVQGPVVTFGPLPSSVCLSYQPISLNALAAPAGGTFSGPGISNCPTGDCFIPANAGIGTHTITYTYTLGACPVSMASAILVMSCPDTCEILNRALDFDGIDDEVTTTSPLNPLPPAFTVACWFRDDRGSSSLFHRIFAWGGVDRFEVGEKNNFLTFYSNLTGSVEISSAVAPADGQWHHVAAVKSASNLLTIYLNGVAVPLLTNIPLALTNLGNIFRLGDWAGPAIGTPRFWQGRIDEFKIWKVALSQAQIMNEMTCSLDPNNINLLVHFPFDQNIANGSNPGATLVQNEVAGGPNGLMNNFLLIGNSSNWVERGRDMLPRCNASHFAWLEGNAGRNYSGRSKVYEGDIFTIGSEVVGGVFYPTFTRRDYEGKIVWRTRLSKTGFFNDFVRTNEGCYLLVGQLPKFTGDNKSFIARIDQTGTLDWFHEHDFAERESLTRIIKSDNPDNPLYPYVVCGIRKNAGTTNDDVLLLTVDNQGNIDWMREIGNKLPLPTDDNFCFDLNNYQGGYMMVGTYDRNAVQHPVLFMTDNTGFQLPASSEYQTGIIFHDAQPAANGQDIILAGELTFGDGLLAKVDMNGNQIWALQFINIKVLRKLVVRPNGDIYAVGQRDFPGVYRNILLKAHDLGSTVSIVWQKHAELTPSVIWPNTENNWTPADLEWYHGNMFFFTDSRISNSAGWGNEDIGAALYNLDQSPDICPFTKETARSQNFSLVPTAMPGLTNVSAAQTTPVNSSTGNLITMPYDSLCPSYSCSCNFTNLRFRKIFPAPAWTKPVSNCGQGSIVLPGCPGQYSPIRFSGQLKCQGGCAFSGLSWTLTAPNGAQYFGTSSTAAFVINISLAMVQASGSYTIVITGQCGTMTCSCTVQFTVPACPAACSCAEPAFSNDVNAGFTWLQVPGCQLKFTPKKLTPCDVVTWKRATFGSSNFTTFATTTGNQTVTQGFTTGTFTICMMVKRNLPGGGFCEATRCQSFSPNCGFNIHQLEAEMRNSVCDNSIVENGGFIDGAEAGGMADLGRVEKWLYSSGNPEVILEAGRLDTNFVRLHGNSGFTDLIFQDSLSVLDLDSIEYSMVIRPIQSILLPETELVVRLSSHRQDSLWCDDKSTCFELMRLPIPQLDSTVWLLAGTIANLTTEPLPYLSIHVENPFVDDDIALQSVVDIDNICLTGYKIVSNNQPDLNQFQIRVFPNPTTGVLNIEMPYITQFDISLQIISLTGQQLLEKKAEPGLSIQTMDAYGLPQGMYFLEILSKGQLIAVNKFVKQ